MVAPKAPTAAQAEKLARKNAKLAPVFARGGEVVLVEPERRPDKPGRVIVGVHDPAQGRSLVALVDAGGVVGVHETPARFQLSSKERALAEKLAQGDERVRSFLRRRSMNGLTRLYFPPAEDPGHRYAIVFIRPTTTERRYAVVDLTEKRVVEVLDEAGLTGVRR